MFCVRRGKPARKETQKDGSYFLRWKEERQVCEKVRTMCHEAIRECGRDSEEVETKVSDLVKSRISDKLWDTYLNVLPGVLRKILAAG